MNNRAEDYFEQDYSAKRKQSELPVSQQILRPGYIMIPSQPIAVASVVASSVVVTVYDTSRKVGGLCHFVKPRPDKNEKSTALCGLPALSFLIQKMIEGSAAENLLVGIYGGAVPSWASDFHRRLAHDNVDVARRYVRRKSLKVYEEDVGGTRGRKLVYNSGTNEIVVMKTENIRRTDWFVHL